VSEKDAVESTRGAPPHTVSSLVRDLKKIGVSEGMTLLVHASLSSIGWVCGGPVAVIYASPNTRPPTREKGLTGMDFPS
jgi:aminoglycoside 3-N-acetyltransferase